MQRRPDVPCHHNSFLAMPGLETCVAAAECKSGKAILTFLSQLCLLSLMGRLKTDPKEVSNQEEVSNEPDDDPDNPGLAPHAFLLTWSALRKQELSIAAEAALNCCLAKAGYLMGFT